jgi:riboflavin kinase/FMN adenylyltransferase
MTGYAIDPELPSGLPLDGKDTVVTIGTFDGIHKGHWEVLSEMRRMADQKKARSVLVTFHPHPLTIVRPELAPPMITTPIEKKEVLAESGLDYAVFLPFTTVLAQYAPRRFVEEILVERLKVKDLVVGYDHHFGRGRTGNTDTLRRLGSELGFDVHVVGPIGIEEKPISSTRIRKALLRGDVSTARESLGRHYSLRGLVVRGDQRGRAMGFPTANLEVGDVGVGGKLIPCPGIYAVKGILRSGTYGGALHLGPRPTFRGSSPSIELHLLDFNEDIYGEEVRVEFISYLRNILPFDSQRALVYQMCEDVEEIREILVDIC